MPKKPTWEILVTSSFGILLVGFFSIFMLSTSLNGEDYAFQKKWSGEGFLERLVWTLNRIDEQVNNWNARLGEQLSIAWLNAPVLTYALAATFAFILASYLVGQISATKQSNLLSTAFSGLTIFALWPSMDIFFWRTANAGYLQPSLFLLGVAYFYLVERNFIKLKNSVPLTLAVSVMAFLSGISFENSPIALGALIFMQLLQYRHQGLKIAFSWMPLVALFAGWLLLISAPSTTYRVGYYRDLFSFPGFTFDYIAKYRIPDVAGVFLNSSWVLVIFFILACVSLINYRDTAFVVSVTVGIFVTLAPLIASPYTEQRAFSFAWFLMITTCMKAIQNHLNLSKIFGLMIAALALGTCFYMLPMYSAFGSALEKRDAQVSEKVPSGCFDDLDFIEIKTSYSHRLLNNRDVWSISTLDQVKKYYGCP